MEGQSGNAIVPQRKINPDQLKKKIDQFSSLQAQQSAQAGGAERPKKSSVLDGAVNITGRPTIQSLKNFLNEQNLQLKTRAQKSRDARPTASAVDLPVPIRAASTYVPQGGFKYKSVLKLRKREKPLAGRKVEK